MKLKLTPEQYRHFALDVVLHAITTNPTYRSDRATRPMFLQWVEIAGIPLDLADGMTPQQAQDAYDEYHTYQEAEG